MYYGEHIVKGKILAVIRYFVLGLAVLGSGYVASVGLDAIIVQGNIP